MQSVQVKKGNKFTVSKHHVSYLHSYAVCVYKFLRTLAWYFSTKNSSYSKNTSRFTLTTSNITNIALHSLMLISCCRGTQTGNHGDRNQTPSHVNAIYSLCWQHISTSNVKHRYIMGPLFTKRMFSKSQQPKVPPSQKFCWEGLCGVGSNKNSKLMEEIQLMQKAHFKSIIPSTCGTPW